MHRGQCLASQPSGRAGRETPACSTRYLGTARCATHQNNTKTSPLSPLASLGWAGCRLSLGKDGEGLGSPRVNIQCEINVCSSHPISIPGRSGGGSTDVAHQHSLYQVYFGSEGTRRWAACLLCIERKKETPGDAWLRCCRAALCRALRSGRVPLDGNAARRASPMALQHFPVDEAGQHQQAHRKKFKKIQCPPLPLSP